jgi:hypothetical protein
LKPRLVIHSRSVCNREKRSFLGTFFSSFLEDPHFGPPFFREKSTPVDCLKRARAVPFCTFWGGTLLFWGYPPFWGGTLLFWGGYPPFLGVPPLLEPQIPLLEPQTPLLEPQTLLFPQKPTSVDCLKRARAVPFYPF